MNPPTGDHKYVWLALPLRSIPRYTYVDPVLRRSLLQVQRTFSSGSLNFWRLFLGAALFSRSVEESPGIIFSFVDSI